MGGWVGGWAMNVFSLYLSIYSYTEVPQHVLHRLLVSIGWVGGWVGGLYLSIYSDS